MSQLRVWCEAAFQVLFPVCLSFSLPQNADSLQCCTPAPLCSVDSVAHKEDDDRMMDTV